MKTTNHIDSGIILQSIPLLSDLPAKELKCFKNNTILKYYKKGTLIESEMKNNLCVIWKGRVEVFRNENNNRKIVFSIIRDGDFLGDLRIFGDFPCNYNFMTRKGTTIIVIKPDYLFALIKKYPLFARKIMNRMIHRLYKSYLYIEVLSIYKAKEKIPAAMIMLNETTKTGDSIIVKDIMPFKEIGQIVSNSREVVSRVMNHHYQNGTIIKRKNGLIINNGMINSYLLSAVSESFA